jgi:cyclopropane fatty-acyl-phospholipid synthase-like methyltransferase
MNQLKNWDNKTWLSSKKYIDIFNSFLLKKIRLNKNSKILDIGCGRGKIIGELSSKLNLSSKPVGIDPVMHKDVHKKINFKKSNAISFLKKNKQKFDLILIKQAIHFIPKSKIKLLIDLCKKNLNKDGKLIILTLETMNNQIPCFKLMKKKLDKSLKKDDEIIKRLKKLSKKLVIDKFFIKVQISKLNYINMLKNRYISTLLKLTDKEINDGIYEIKKKYKKNIKFLDILVCLVYSKQ